MRSGLQRRSPVGVSTRWAFSPTRRGARRTRPARGTARHAAIKRVDAGFSTAQEETAQMTGGDYNRNIKLHMTEAKRKREVDEIGKAQTAGE